MLKSSSMKQTMNVIIATVFVGCSLRRLRQFKPDYILNTVVDIYIDIFIQTQRLMKETCCI